MARSPTDLSQGSSSIHALSGRSAQAGGLADGAAEIRLPSRHLGTRVLLPLAVLAAFALLLAYAARDLLLPAVNVEVIPVVARPVAAGSSQGAGQNGQSALNAPASSTSFTQAPGWIEPQPFPTLVPALVEGVVKEVLVLEGQPIEKDQVVARLIDDDLRIADRAAKAALAERKADALRANASFKTAQAGVLVEQAAADAIRDDIERKRTLAPSGYISAGEFRKLEIQLAGAEAQIARAQSAVAEAQAAQQQSQAAIEAAQVACDFATLQLSRCEIRSPAAGTVMALLVSPGSRISMGENSDMPTSILKLYDPLKLQVRVDVPLSEVARVSVGSSAEITTEALPGQTFTGRVERLVHEANIQRNTVQFKVSIDQPSPQLKPEMLARVKLRSSMIADATGGNLHTADHHANHAMSIGGGLEMVLPISVLVDRTGDRATVWIAQSAATPGVATATKREITFAQAPEPDHVIVLGGLNPGDRVIAWPSADLSPGTRVRIAGESHSSASEGTTP